MILLSKLSTPRRKPFSDGQRQGRVQSARIDRSGRGARLFLFVFSGIKGRGTHLGR
jgi:hypothetical protein